MKLYTGIINIRFLNSLFSYTKFGDLTGIKSAKEGKEWEDWSKPDRAKWWKNSKKIISKTFMSLTYLSSENLYFVKTNEDSFFTARENYKNDLIHRYTVVGDFEGFKPRIDFLLYQRYKNDKEDVLVPCLKYIEEDLNEERNHFKPLCEIPNFYEHPDFDKYGFERKDDSGDYTDDFGEKASSFHSVHKKNGVEVFFL